MRCPKCNKDNLTVVDSREKHKTNEIRRRRGCLDCGTRFTTLETIRYKDLIKFEPPVMKTIEEISKELGYNVAIKIEEEL